MPKSDLRKPAQVTPTQTEIICIAMNAAGGFDVTTAGTLPTNASDQAIMALINSGKRDPLPPRSNPFDLKIEASTDIVYHLDTDGWFFTERQFRLKDGTENDTPSAGGGNREFGSLRWVDDNGTDRQKTIAIVDTWRRMEKFEYGLFLALQQDGMETIIEIDPVIENDERP